MRKKAVALVVATVIVLGGGWAFIAKGEEGAHEVVPEIGGQWAYGASGGRTWSNFLHEQPHGASVQGHTFVDSGCVPGGRWARAEAPVKWVPLLPNDQDIRLCEQPGR